MKLLLALLAVSCVSCTVRGPTKLPNGVELPSTASLGGDHQEIMRYDGNPGGSYMFARRDRQTESFRDATQAAALVGAGMISASVTKAADAADAAVILGAQKQATRQAAIAADVTKAGIAADVTKTIVLPK